MAKELDDMRETMERVERDDYYEERGKEVGVGGKHTHKVSMEHRAKGTATIESRRKINFAP